MLDSNQFGRQIKQLRSGHGWTQEFLAYKTGLSLSTVSHIEQGRQVEISWPTLDRLDKVFGQRGKLILFYRNRQK